MLADFAVVIGVAFVPRIWPNKQLPDVHLSHDNHKRDPHRNVALISFVGKIITIVVNR
jgi:hypothetical protein